MIPFIAPSLLGEGGGRRGEGDGRRAGLLIGCELICY